MNVRLAYGLHSIGKGKSAGRMLCGMLNLPKPPVHFEKYTNILKSYVKTVAENTMSDAVEVAVLQNCDGISDE